MGMPPHVQRQGFSKPGIIRQRGSVRAKNAVERYVSAVAVTPKIAVDKRPVVKGALLSLLHKNLRQMMGDFCCNAVTPHQRLL
jgi:hypothetical protein